MKKRKPHQNPSNKRRPIEIDEWDDRHNPKSLYDSPRRLMSNHQMMMAAINGEWEEIEDEYDGR
jgi:hypothetical protein